MHDLLRDLRQALRRLLKTPLFTAVAVITLALALGANTAVFSVIHGVLVKPLPFDGADRLVGVWYKAPGLGFDQLNQCAATYFTTRDDSRVFEDIGLWDNTQVTVTGLDEPEQVEALQVTDGTLPLLRVQPQLGRTFTAEEDLPDGPQTVILSHGYWQRRFAADPAVLGRTLRIDGEEHEIIGVLPASFHFLDADPELLLTFQFDRAKTSMDNFSFQAVARLQPGATVEAANADVDRLIPVAEQRFPGGITQSMLDEARFAANVHPFKEDAVGDVGSALWVLLGTVGLVLLIACANVANLFLVRAESRQLEVAVRTALGAGRGDRIRAYLAESLWLGVAAGGLGLGLAWAAIRLLHRLAPPGLPRLEDIGLDPQVIAFAFLLALLAAALFGIVPGLRQRSGQLAVALKEGGRGGSEGRERHRARSTLVVVQVALALVLLVGSGLMLRSFQALHDVQPGFRDPDHLLTFRLAIPSAEIEDSLQAFETFVQIEQRLAAIPGVDAVGLSSSLTMDRHDSNNAFYVEDFPTPEGQLPPIRRMKWISPNYFATMGNPLLVGRDFTWDEVRNARPVVIVTANLVKAYWDDPATALGKHVRSGPGQTWSEIIGVVGDVYDNGVGEDAVPVAYWPMVAVDGETGELFSRRSVAYAVRSDRLGTSGLLEDVQQAVWGLNASLPLANVRSMREIFDRSMARTAFTLVMLLIAAAVALVLGAVGLYGVTAYSVTQRTRELGIRLALGAGRGEVQGLVLRQAILLAGIGIVVGAAAALGLTRLMAALLFGVSALDPTTYAAVAGVLLLIAVIAAYLPARRAARTDPLVVLRWE
ncbi:MAG: ABC transporter permease [Acidobacteria bacterium]|nr:ABC transporter permease [Acidobacteriota bacterium]